MEEIGHAVELKIKSRNKADGYSGEETKEMATSSETDLELSSDCDTTTLTESDIYVKPTKTEDTFAVGIKYITKPETLLHIPNSETNKGLNDKYANTKTGSESKRVHIESKTENVTGYMGPTPETALQTDDTHAVEVHAKLHDHMTGTELKTANLPSVIKQITEYGEVNSETAMTETDTLNIIEPDSKLQQAEIETEIKRQLQQTEKETEIKPLLQQMEKDTKLKTNTQTNDCGIKTAFELQTEGVQNTNEPGIKQPEVKVRPELQKGHTCANELNSESCTDREIQPINKESEFEVHNEYYNANKVTELQRTVAMPAFNANTEQEFPKIEIKPQKEQVESANDFDAELNAAKTNEHSKAAVKIKHKEKSAGLATPTKIFRKRFRKKMKVVNAKQRIRTRSLIMFVVTLIFNITTFVYFCIFTIVVGQEHIFQIVTTDTAGVLFFFWRIYFINHVINPVVYGFLDPRFRIVIKRCSRRLRVRCRKLITHESEGRKETGIAWGRTGSIPH